ncbi:MAG: LbtU family siderophore porin [Desulfobacteraceae bacterium]
MKKMTLWLFCLVLILGFSVPCAAHEATPSDSPTPGGVKSLEDRIKQLEAAMDRTPESARWYDRIQVSGLIEVEAAYQEIDYGDPGEPDEKSSDVDLATVELAFDAKVADNVDGHVLIKYEDDEVFVDEGFITLSGGEAFPAYLIAGRQYIPFGNFDSHFITDPNTLILGETNEGAVVAGYRLGGQMVDFSAGVFNGRANEAGDDDTVDSVVAAVVVNPLESVLFGASYTSNLAGSDALSEVLVDADNLDSLVGGWSAFASVEFLERFYLIAEYVAAVDDFRAGELYAATDSNTRKPSAWNLELGIALAEGLEVAARYGGSDDGADFLPESQYGAVISWGIFENTNLALEYLHDEFEDDVQEVDTLTAQLAVEF